MAVFQPFSRVFYVFSLENGLKAVHSFLNQNRKNYLKILGNKEKVQSPELDVPLPHSDVIRAASMHVVSSVA